jgi:predicted MFS family arabinose efflux permease
VKRLNPLRGRAYAPAEGPGEGRPADASAGVLQTLRETPLSAHVVLIGIFINQVAAFVQIYLVLFLHARGFSYTQGGFALGCFSVGAIAGTFGGGALSDWLGPRWTIVVSMGATGLFTYALTLFGSLPPIYVAAALSGALSRSSATASAALLFDLVPKNRQVMMSAMRRSAINGGLSVAPLPKRSRALRRRSAGSRSSSGRPGPSRARAEPRAGRDVVRGAASCVARGGASCGAVLTAAGPR